jgi:hypothetical protein
LAVYGLKADVDANKGKNVILYVPGKTKLTPQDIFLGGTGTGVSDEDLHGAQRIFGNTAQDTANALDDWKSDLASQIRAAQITNSAPRPDADKGIPTLARQQMEIEQAQNTINNAQNIGQLTGMYNGKPTLAQKAYDHSVEQDKFNNGISVGQLTGTYNGQDTLARQAQAIQDAQFRASLAQDNNQFYQTLASKYASQSPGYTPTLSKANSSTRTMATQIINALHSGATIDEILNDIEQMERDGTAAAEQYNTQVLRNLALSTPVDNWQLQPR